MATITLTIPDAFMPRAVDALCAVGGWTSLEADGPKGAFAKSVVATYVKTTVHAVESENAKAAALSAVVPPDQIEVS